MSFDHRFPSAESLRQRARERMPRFAFEYLDGGCNEEVNLRRNRDDLQAVQLRPRYLADFAGCTLETELFGQLYSAPFGVAPVGLQGLMWPGSAETLARAASRHRLPFVLSTVSTASIETVAEICDGRMWFQLYHPTRDELRDKLLDRAAAAGVEVLVVLADTPTFSYRPREIRNGLSIPPRLSLANLWQMLVHPSWSWGQLRHGMPRFATMEPYLPAGLKLAHLGEFMAATFEGRLNRARLAALRERWKGRLIVKGVVCEADAELCLEVGADGFVVSNHGGRQLDAGQSSIVPLTELADRYGQRTCVMMDSGIRSGPDIARSLASGARFTFLGRTFMYGVAALGEPGGDHTIAMLERQLRQVLEQLGCSRTEDLPQHLVS
mgnify:CR=1 FL=1